ncbi:unnamed protein product, partial [Brassica oleracea var. botrytis]
IGITSSVVRIWCESSFLKEECIPTWPKNPTHPREYSGGDPRRRETYQTSTCYYRFFEVCLRSYVNYLS